MPGSLGLFGAYLVLCWIVAPFGLWKLFKHGAWRSAIAFVLLAAGIPAALNLVAQLPDEHQRFWVGLPLLPLIPIWLLLGPAIIAAVMDSPDKTDGRRHRADGRQVRSTTAAREHRALGAALLCMFVVAWYIGFTSPEMSTRQQGIVAALTLLTLIVGLYWVVTGRGINDP